MTGTSGTTATAALARVRQQTRTIRYTLWVSNDLSVVHARDRWRRAVRRFGYVPSGQPSIERYAGQRWVVGDCVAPDC